MAGGNRAYGDILELLVFLFHKQRCVSMDAHTRKHFAWTRIASDAWPITDCIRNTRSS